LQKPTASLLGACLSMVMTMASLPVALAAPPADKGQAPIDTEARAMQAFTDGKAAYDAGKYEDALKLFLDAQSLYPSPVFHYNIGLCHEALGKLDQAIISYEAYLRSYQNAFGEPPEDQINTQNKIDRLNKQIEAEKAAAEKPPEPVVVAPPPEPVEEQPQEAGKPGRGMIIAGGVLTGIGVGAAVVGGSIYGAVASDVSGQLDNVYLGGNPERVTLEDARALDEKGRLAELNQILLLSLGGAIGVVGIALLAAGISKRNRAASQSAMLIPTAGLSSAGLVLQGRF
jgi:tetratricopeptide (TPR) repeat protein